MAANPASAQTPQSMTLSYETLKRWGVGVLAMLGMVFIFDFLDDAESFVYGTEQAFRGTFSTPMRMLGIPHFIIGLLFMCTSARMQNRRSYLHIATALLTSAFIIWVVYRLGGPFGHPATIVLIFLGFLVHEFRDQYSFYQHDRGGSPAESSASGQIITILLIGFFFILVAIGWSLQFVLPNPEPDTQFVAGLQQMSTATYVLWWLGPLIPPLSIAGFCFTWVKRNYPDQSIVQRIYQQRIIWLIYLGTITLVLLLLPFKGKAESIVLLHVVTWWVFATRNLQKGKVQLSSENKPNLKGWLNKVKRTQTGFQLFHWSLVLLMCALSIYWFQILGGPSGHLLEFVVTPAGFFYWTIFHVTMSFVPK